MSRTRLLAITLTLSFALLTASAAFAQVTLIAKGTLTGSRAGANTDLSGLTYNMEDGLPANLLGGMGSGLTFASGNVFLGIPDRGPNAVPYDALIEDTTSYIPRFHTIRMMLQPSSSGPLPFVFTPQLISTTLLFSRTPLTYGTGDGLGVGPGEPPSNRTFRYYFSGRSDNYDATQNSGNANEARFDPEGIRVSSDGRYIYISDEYGPYVYEFLRATGQRTRTFHLPDSFFVATQKPTTNDEIAANTTGRTPNKGMEGLAITPDGKTLLGIIQAPFIEDAAAGGAAGKLVRMVTIDIESGETTHVYAYSLTTGSGVSEITALNDHEFLVDERDGKGLGDGSNAKVKQIFKIDLTNAVDVTGLNGTMAAANSVSKSLFLDVVQVLVANGITADQIPAKLEGLTLGPDVVSNGQTIHTLWIANDNDFLPDYAGPGTNPNQFFVFGFTDAALNGSRLVPQNLSGDSEID
jgi:hypothetical protein